MANRLRKIRGTGKRSQGKPRAFCPRRTVVFMAISFAFVAFPAFGQNVMPRASDAIQYVSANGSTSNDGLSWGTSKATIDGALNALPAAGGTIELAAGTYDLTHPVVLGGPKRTVNLVLKQGALIRCEMTTTESCINLAYTSSIEGPSHGLTAPTNIEAVRGSSMASVIGTSIAAVQGPAVHITDVRVNLAPGSTITNSAIDVCGQENGDSFLEFSIHDHGALGTHSLLHIDGTCHGKPVSNGVGYIEDAALECYGTPGCIPLDIQGAKGVLAFNWIMTNVVTEDAGARKPEVYFDGSQGGGEEFLVAGLHIESGSSVGAATGPAILIDHMANVAILDPYIGFFGLSKADNVNAIEIRNTSGSPFWSNVYVRNIHTTANGVAALVNTIDNTVSHHVVNACRYGCDTASYTWVNSSWSNAHPSYFDGPAPQVNGIPVGVVSAGTITLSSGAGTHTFGIPYPSAPVCTASDTTRPALVQVRSTPTTIDVSGSGNDVVRWICTPAAN